MVQARSKGIYCQAQVQHCSTCVYGNLLLGSHQAHVVTGTHKQPSKFVNPKSNRLYAGVGGVEYNEVLSQHLMILNTPNSNKKALAPWVQKTAGLLVCAQT